MRDPAAAWGSRERWMESSGSDSTYAHLERRSRRDPGNIPQSFRFPPAQTVLPQTPYQQLEAVLTEERLVREHHRRHPPVARDVERALIRLDDVVVPPRLLRDRRVELDQ